MKYIIEINPIPGTSLFKAEGFNTLVFDKIGLEKLKPLTEHSNKLKAGDIFRTPNGTTEYEFIGYSQIGRINCVNNSNGNYTCLPNSDYVVVRSVYDELITRISKEKEVRKNG